MPYHFVFLLLLALGFLPTPARAQGRQFAVIVALDYNWTDRDNRLQFTISDANRFRRFLDIPDAQTISLTDAPTASKGERATRTNILAAVRSLMAKTAPDDTLWFYYSGHGKFLQSENASYIIPADVTRLDAKTAISVSEIRALLADKTHNKARASVLVLDACETGSSRKWVNAGASAPELRPMDGVNTFAAARTDRSAYETEKAPVQGGLFTYYLCAGLAGAMASPQSPQVTLEALSKYVTAEVNAACERIGKPAQEPVFLASGADWQHVVVGAYRNDVLAGLNMGEANQLTAAAVSERPPLEPGVIVVLSDDSVGVDSGALAYLKEQLVSAGVPLLSEEVVAPFLALLRNPQKSPEALAEAERYNARLLLRVRVVSNLKPSQTDSDVIKGTVTMEAEILDVSGRVNASVVDTATARPNSQAEKALDDGIRKASDLVLAKLKTKLPLKSPAP